MVPRFRVNLMNIMTMLPRGGVVARVFSDATNPQTGFNYFFAVDSGRRPVRPVRRKVLRWLPSPRTISPLSGRERFVGAVFARRSKAFGGYNLRRKALAMTASALEALVAQYDMRAISLASLVNRAASIVVAALARLTPRKSGRLARSYSIKEAG